MIDGMTIVSAGHTMPDMAVGLIVLGVVLSCVFFAFGFVSVKEDSNKGGVVAFAGLALSLFMLVYGATMPPTLTIKVILKPDVDMIELMQRYEVQSIDGQIWELVEKEQKDDEE